MYHVTTGARLNRTILAKRVEAALQALNEDPGLVQRDQDDEPLKDGPTMSGHALPSVLISSLGLLNSTPFLVFFSPFRPFVAL